jgi:hypothetical protein
MNSCPGSCARYPMSCRRVTAGWYLISLTRKRMSNAILGSPEGFVSDNPLAPSRSGMKPRVFIRRVTAGLGAVRREGGGREFPPAQKYAPKTLNYSTDLITRRRFAALRFRPLFIGRILSFASNEIRSCAVGGTSATPRVTVVSRIRLYSAFISRRMIGGSARDEAI